MLSPHEEGVRKPAPPQCKMPAMRYRLRTLLILLAVLPPLLALGWRGWPTVRDSLWPPLPTTIQVSFDPLGGPTPKPAPRR